MVVKKNIRGHVESIGGECMIVPKFKNRGMVRAVFVVSVRGNGVCSSVSREDAEKYGNIWAVGIWRRDDEKNLLELLERDFDILSNAYRKLCGNEYHGGGFTYEYRDYER